MKATDLQIGDWVYNTHNRQNEQVAEIGSGLVMLAYNDLYEYDEIKSIPLEKVHLTKNGFKPTDESDKVFTYYDGYKVMVTFHEGFQELKVPPSIFLQIKFAKKDLTMPIEYVHELQQAMRIMGCDKEIKL